MVDDGLDVNHPDLAANAAPGSINFLNGGNDPSSADGKNSHGTKVAGIAAAVASNHIGGPGAAPAAKLQGFNRLKKQTADNWRLAHGFKPDGSLRDLPTGARVFNQRYGSVPVKSMPGNPDADLSLKLREQAYQKVSQESHGGRGAVFVKTAGNGYLNFKRGEDLIFGSDGNHGLPMQDANIPVENSDDWNVVLSALNAGGKRASYFMALD